MVRVRVKTPRKTYPVLVRVFDNAELLGKAVAENICFMVSRCRMRGSPAVLGLASGVAFAPVYEALSQCHQEGGFSFSTCHTFNLSEYYPMAPASEKSLGHYLDTATSSLDIYVENRHAFMGDLPEGEIDAHCLDYERRISMLGGIGYQLLGIGQNGCIGFNEPGSLYSDRSRLVNLKEETIPAAAPGFGGDDHVPRRALTMGIKTILDAKEICLVALGEQKASIVKRFIDSPPSPSLTATYLKTHAAAAIYLDRAAAKLLSLRGDFMAIQ